MRSLAQIQPTHTVPLEISEFAFTAKFEIGFHVLLGETISNPNAEPIVKRTRLEPVRPQTTPTRQEWNVNYLTILIQYNFIGHLQSMS